MVSLKDLPYEFVFLTKPPSDPTPKSVSPLFSQSSSLSYPIASKVIHQPRYLRREEKPQSCLSVFKARLRLIRGIRFEMRRAVRYRYRSFGHHAHKCHANPSKNWKEVYQQGLGKSIAIKPEVVTRPKLMRTITEKLKKNPNSRYMSRYFQRLEKKAQISKDSKRRKH